MKPGTITFGPLPNVAYGSSIPGLQLFHALQDYGAYIVDTTNYATPDNTYLAYQFGLQAEAAGEFQDHYGYSFDGYSGNATAAAAWRSDLVALVSAMALVDDNAPTSIGGHGDRLVPGAGPLTPMDMSPPTAPSNLQVTSLGTESATISWTGSTDNVRVMDYKLYNGSMLLATTYSQTSVTTKTLQPGQTFSVYAIAEDTGMNDSPSSNVVTFTTLMPTTNNFEEFFNVDPGWQYTNASVAGGGLTILNFNYPGGGEAIDTKATVVNGYSFTSDVSGYGGCYGNIARILFNYQDDGDTYAFEFNGYSACGPENAWAQLVKYQNGNATILGKVNLEYSYPTTEIDVTTVGLITVYGINNGAKTQIVSAADATFNGGEIGFAIGQEGIGVHNVVVKPLP